MKQLHVIQLIGSTGLYGAERWILALIRAFNPKHIRSTLINLVDAQDEKPEVVNAAHQRGLEGFDFYTGGRFNLGAAVRLARWSRQNRVDIIHGHGFKSDMLGLFSARLAGCKVISTPHGWSLEKDLKLKLYESLDRILFRFMHQVCPLSPDLAKEFKQKSGYSNIRFILNGVDLEEIDAVEGSEKSNNKFSIGYIGQLIERKNLKTLLQAISMLDNITDKIKLILIGEGALCSKLEYDAENLGIKDKVSFMGFRPDALNFLKTFDIFVLPSLMEGIPRCIMEAMACGVPVLASDIPGNRELVIHGKTGLLFPTGDVNNLTESIRYIINHPDEAKMMATEARTKVENEFSSKRMAAEYAKLYSELCNSSPEAK